MITPIGIASVFVLLIINFLLYAAESAILQAQEEKLKEALEDKNSNATRRLLDLKNDPERFFSTVHIVSTAISATMAVALFTVLSDALPGIFPQPLSPHVQMLTALSGSLVLTVVLSLVFGPLVPRALGRNANEKTAQALAGPLTWLASLHFPLRRVLYGIGKVLLFFVPRQRDTKIAFTADEEREEALREGVESDENEEEDELINSVCEFVDMDVRDIMVPKSRICSLQVDEPWETALKFVVENGFSRYPVFQESLDDTMGILYNKDLLAFLEKGQEFTIRDLVRPIHFVPEKAKVSQALKDMQKRGLNMFMVVNEYGSVIGLATVEDAIEEIVGDVRDENEDEEKPVIEQADGSLLIDASMPVRELQSDYDLPLEESDEYDSLAGFMLAQISSVPRGGETVEADGFQYTIEKLDDRRITWVRAARTSPNS